jgi:Ceramidase
MSLVCPSLIGDYYPDLCRAVDIYCERTTSALDAEPVNALTNVAFLVAAGFAWHLESNRPNPSTTGIIRVLTAITAVVGLGSFLFHTVATRWAEWGDVIPIVIFMLLFLWFVLTYFFGWLFWTKLIALLLFVAVTVYLESAVPSAILWGGALYVPALVLLIAIGAALYRRQHAVGRAMLAAVGIFLLSFTARTLDAPICAMFPLGTHFAWHILNATLLFLLVRLAILYAPRGSSATSRRV